MTQDSDILAEAVTRRTYGPRKVMTQVVWVALPERCARPKVMGKVTAENAHEFAGQRVLYQGAEVTLLGRYQGDIQPRSPAAFVASPHYFGDAWRVSVDDSPADDIELFPGQSLVGYRYGYFVAYGNLQEVGPRAETARQPQSQESLEDQLRQLVQEANHMGLYDAADFITRALKKG